MPLGYTYTDAPAQMILQTGRHISESLRDLGRQVSGHLAEIKTKEDLEALGQDLQSVDVKSPSFARDLISVAAKHPMAMSDRRGGLLVGTMGQMYKDMREKDEFQEKLHGQTHLEGFRHENQMREIGEQERLRRERPVDLAPNHVLSDPLTGERLASGPEVTSSRSPLRSAGGSLYDERSREWITPPAKPAAELSESQRSLIGDRDRKAQIAAKLQSLSTIRKNRDTMFEQWSKTRKDASAEMKPELDAQMGEVKKLDDQAAAIQAEIDQLSATPATNFAPAPSAINNTPGQFYEAPPSGDIPLGLPTPGPLGAPKTRIISKGGKRYEVDDESKKVLRQLE